MDIQEDYYGTKDRAVNFMRLRRAPGRLVSWSPCSTATFIEGESEDIESKASIAIRVLRTCEVTSVPEQCDIAN